MTGGNFSDKLKNNKCGVVLFYKPSCTWCKKTKELWHNLAEIAVFCNIYAFNCEKYIEFCVNKRSGNLILTSYPSIVMYKDGIASEVFHNQRNLPALLLFVMQKIKQ